MNTDLTITLALLLGCITLFIINKPRMDTVALLVIVILPLTGILTVPEALAGFSDPAVILIAALFVVGEGLVRTGIAYQMGDWLVARAGSSETRLLVLLMTSVAILGAVMSSTGIVAIFIPVVLSVAARMGISPGRLMMPLSFAGLISGMQTLVATPPNMIVDGALKREGLEGFGFFSFTPIGAVVLVLGILYMLVARNWLSDGSDKEDAAASRRTFQNLIEDYQLSDHGQSLLVKPGSSLIGKTLDALSFRRAFNANVVGIRRRGRFQQELINPGARTEIKANDLLLVDAMHRTELSREEIENSMGVDVLRLKGTYFTDRAREVGMAEVLLPPESDLLKKTVHEAEFRKKYRLHVVGLRRAGKAMETGYLEEKLRLGDTLLVVGPWNAIRHLQTQHRDFVVLSLPAEVDSAAPAQSKAPYALLSLAVMVVLMVSGWVPNLHAALIACMLMGAFGCLNMSHVYKAINWQSLIVIVGMMPFALALEKTGGIQLAVNGLMGAVGEASPRLLLGSLFVLTAVTGMFISNTATAVLMAPIAVTIAAQSGMSAQPFAMIVALAASAAFMAPISSPVNMLVLAPGQYRFMDFVKVGVPFTVLVLIISVVMVPWLFPL